MPRTSKVLNVIERRLSEIDNELARLQAEHASLMRVKTEVIDAKPKRKPAKTPPSVLPPPAP